MTQQLTLDISAPPPYELFDNPGPVIAFKVEPSLLVVTATGVKRTWYCRAVGEKPIVYRWYKEGQV